MTEQDFREETALCVQRGMELLDHDRPGWAAKIDLSTLRMGNVCCCVIGQIFGAQDYRAYVIALQLLFPAIATTGARHGFDILPHLLVITTISNDMAYDILTDLWATQIRARQQGATA